MGGVFLLEMFGVFLLTHRKVNGEMPDISVCGDQAFQLTPELPYFLGGVPQPEQVSPGINKNDGAYGIIGVV